MGLKHFLDSLRRTSPAAVKERVRAVAARVGAMSPDAARAEAEALLRTPHLFRVERAPPTPDEAAALALLPPAVRPLLDAFRSVELGGMQVSRADVGPYARDPAYVRIGADMEHADVIARRSDGAVFVVENDGREALNLEDAHATVWHYLVEVAEHTRAA